MLGLLCEASCQAQLVINEVMYHPFETWPTNLPAPIPNPIEYIELFNAGSQAENLADYRLDDGVSAGFPGPAIINPGEYVVVCEDTFAFSNAYPDVTVRVFGNYQGRLRDRGEWLALSRWTNDTWITADRIRYVDGGTADGGGVSLELVHPGFALLDEQGEGAWLPSTTPHGTPGAANSVYNPTPRAAVAWVTHSPALPPAGSCVTVTARILGVATSAPVSANVKYRLDAVPQNSWSTAPMKDDGTGGDIRAGDGIFTVRLPQPGAPALSAGALLEFRVEASCLFGVRVAPSVNTAGAQGGSYSYYCCFGEDAAFDGEYDTYHILMTQANRNLLESRGAMSDVLLDAAFVTSDGEIFYGCGVRYRGGPLGRSTPPHNYRVEFPRRGGLDGLRELDLNWRRPLLQYIGLSVMREGGYGMAAPEPKLCRLWVNETISSDVQTGRGYGGVYIRVQDVEDDAFLEEHFGTPLGNLYKAKDYGVLDYRTPISEYQRDSNPPAYPDARPDYRARTNNPVTVWHDLDSLCWTLDQSVSQYPSILTNRMNVRQWARYYGIQVALENAEGGIYCSSSCSGDDYFAYGHPVSGQFHIIPWDMDNIIDEGRIGWDQVDAERSIWAWEGPWGPYAGDATPIVTKFLFNLPVAPLYVGDVVDVHQHLLSADSMNRIFDDMGSAISSFYRSELLYWIGRRRTAIMAEVRTNLTVRIDGVPADPVAHVADVSGITVTSGVFDVNQRVTGWVPVGSFWFDTSEGRFIRVERVSTGSTITVADAVMLSNEVQTLVVDDAVAGAVAAGKWYSGSDGSAVGGQLRYSATAGDSFQWPVSNSVAGVYDVYAASVPQVGFLPSDTAAAYQIASSVELGLTPQFSGLAPQNYTARVLVDGEEAVWNPRLGTWASEEKRYFAAVSDVTVQAMDHNDDVVAEQLIRLVAERLPVGVSGMIDVDTLWQSTDGTYVVTGDVHVAETATVTVAPGTVVQMKDGRSMSVAGRLVMAGTISNAVTVVGENAASAWAIVVSGSNAVVEAAYADGLGGSLRIENGASAFLTNCVLSDSDAGQGIIAASSGAVVEMDRCVVRDYAKARFTNVTVRISRSLFSNMTVCGLDVAAPEADSRIERVTISRSRNADVAGIVLTTCDGLMISNVLAHALSGSAFALVASSNTITDSLVYDCAAFADTALDGNLLLRHGTVSTCTEGAIRHGVLESSIVWANGDLFDEMGALASFSNIERADTNVVAGVGNMNRQPFFMSSVEDDFRLAEYSPCRGTGVDGTDMGVRFPVGALPAAPSGMMVTNLAASRIELVWAANDADAEAYVIERRADGEGWVAIAETAETGTAYEDNNVQPNTVYDYRVRAMHGRGTSLASVHVTAVTPYGTDTESLRSHLRITEIMYHPPAGGAFEKDEYEFLELMNIGAEPLDLTGLYFDRGIDYSFPGGTELAARDTFLLVKNPEAFAARYPGVVPQGVFLAGYLKNSGERLRIRDAAGNTVLDLEYGDRDDPGWYPSTDGEGYALILVDSEADPDHPAAWSAGVAYGGTPGVEDAVPPGVGVVINEILAHQDQTDPGDWIELNNLETHAVDVGGWFLSDSQDALRRFMIPSPHVIAPGGYARFTEHDDFGPGVLGTNGFAISELGETLYLSSGQDGQLTNLRKWERFGASDRDVTFGRWTLSDGRVDFVTLAGQTPGASNGLPRVGPVVINEIMYNPARGGREFIELCNVSSTSVPLYLTNMPSAGWELDGGVEYTFTGSETLAVGEHLLVVGTDPDDFRQRFGIDPSIRICGPFEGDLANGGETVELYKPGRTEPDGRVPRILVDRVQYDDVEPWPVAADNGGGSLERISSLVYGNEPANWMAATLGGTPGSANIADGRPGIAFRVPALTVVESNASVTIDLVAFPAPVSPVFVHCALADTAATPGTDFAFTNQAVVFWPYETNRSVTLQILDDVIASGEPDEYITIVLDGVSTNARLGGQRAFTLTIVDDEVASLPAPTVAPFGTVTFLHAVAVTLETAVPSAVIHYTLDGSEPELTSPRYSGPILIQDTARLRAAVFLGSSNRSPSTSSLFLKQALSSEWVAPTLPSNVIEVAANMEHADAEESATEPHNVNLHRHPLVLGDPAYAVAAFHFRNVSVPFGARITNAWVRFSAAATSSGSLNLALHGQRSADAAPFLPGARDLTERPRTAAAVAWSPPAWGAGDSGAAQTTPNLRAIIQEIVRQPRWAPNQSMALFVTAESAASIRSLWSYDGDPLRTAVLHVEFTTDAAESADLGTPIVWLQQHYTNTDYNALELTDTDNDGMLCWEEYVADTCPTVTASRLMILQSYPVLRWLSRPTRSYVVYRSTNILGPWPVVPITNAVPGMAGGTNEYLDVDGNGLPRLYRIGVMRP